MARCPPGWLDEVRPLPGGWITRVLLVTVVAALIALDLAAGQLDLRTRVGWIFLIAPCLPLIALIIGALPAALTLLLVTVGLLGALATGGTEYQIAQLTFPAAISVGLCTMMLPLRVAQVFASSSVVLLSLAIVIRPTQLAITTVLLVVLLVIVAASAGLGLNLYGRRNDRGTAQIRTLREQQDRIRADERTTLAHELHDIVAHDVTIIAMQARRAMLLDDPVKTAQIIEGIGDSAQQALADLRSLVLLLKDDSSGGAATDESDLFGSREPPGGMTSGTVLTRDLESLADALRQAGFDVALTVAGELALVPATLRQALRRTIRELGTNVLKHADPSHPVQLTMAVDSGSVTLTTTNEPTTTRPLSSSTTGIEAMHARCEVFRGSVTSGMTRGKWHTTMTLPLDGALQAATQANEAS